MIYAIHKTVIVNAEKIVFLKYLSHFWRTLQILLVNCEINLTLTCSKDCIHFEVGRVTTFAITDRKHYVPDKTLSIQNNAKVLQKLNLSFTRPINWYKYQSKEAIQTQNRYLDYLSGPSFQGVNRLFASTFEDNTDRTGHTRYYFQK